MTMPFRRLGISSTRTQARKVTESKSFRSRARTRATRETSSEPDEESAEKFGLTMTALTPEAAQRLRAPADAQGALISEVEQGSPADKSGLHGSFKPASINGDQILVGGDVITALDGKAVNSMNDLKTAIGNKKPGVQINLTVLRDNAEVTVEVKLDKRPQ